MTNFIHDNFLLQSKSAVQLYHEYAVELPIIDYHNHLSPKEIAEDRIFENLTQVWLEGDHYKWRAMRANGIDEHFITGGASDWEKFEKWAKTVPYTMRNPLYHWTHLELKRYFGISKLLSPDTAKEIYEQCSDMLKTVEFSTRNLLQKMKVESLCTTDDPASDLAFHENIRTANINIKVLPTFRPDKLLTADQPRVLKNCIEKLELVSNSRIKTIPDLLEAIEGRALHFSNMGCRLSDHGLSQMISGDCDRAAINTQFAAWRENGTLINPKIQRQFNALILHELGKMYHKNNWIQQFHLGAIRNNNSRLMSTVGADAGYDSIGDFEQATALSDFLNKLDTENKLTKTILYNLNPRDNEVFAAMIGNFQDGSIPGKMQWGSAWWFLDQKDGMEKQIDTLSNMGLLSRFVGMLTDSRSFLSFPRHEYFRRILCNKLGRDIEEGLLPDDINWLGKLIQNICFNNAKEYFEF